MMQTSTVWGTVRLHHGPVARSALTASPVWAPAFAGAPFAPSCLRVKPVTSAPPCL